jgi:hypothetical protein
MAAAMVPAAAVGDVPAVDPDATHSRSVVMTKKFPASPAILLLLALAGLAGCSASHPAPVAAPSPVPEQSVATESAQATYPTADLAVADLIAALRANDSARLTSILGPGADRVLYSSDPVDDQQHEQNFLNLYDEKHALVPGDNGATILTVGASDWPFPIPLVSDGQAWRFDTQAGLDEILNRRIGTNELAAIQVCLAIVDAQRDYAWRNPTGANVPEYAQKFFSDPGRKNGLYWPTTGDEQPSPLGPLVAQATDQGYSPAPGTNLGTHPYHGYLYRILTAQGAGADGGALDYLVDGKMLGGFAIVAYPAQYGNSGVMSFIVNYDGVVYQKDLGTDTKNIADTMQAFDPGEGWAKVPPSDESLTDDSN